MFWEFPIPWTKYKFTKTSTLVFITTPHVSKLGIHVAEVASDGLYSEKEFVQYTNGLGFENLNTFTCCLRFYVEYLRPDVPTILSYSSFIHDNSLSAFLNHESDTEHSFKFCKYYNLNGITTFCSKKIMTSIIIDPYRTSFS